MFFERCYFVQFIYTQILNLKPDALLCKSTAFRSTLLFKKLKMTPSPPKSVKKTSNEAPETRPRHQRLRREQKSCVFSTQYRQLSCINKSINDHTHTHTHTLAVKQMGGKTVPPPLSRVTSQLFFCCHFYDDGGGI